MMHVRHVLGFISIHAPLAGRDQDGKVRIDKGFIFQSTRPLRGATRGRRCSLATWPAFQSTRPLRGATAGRQGHVRGDGISIHVPLAGCDPADARRSRGRGDFNPCTPCGVRRGERNAHRHRDDYFNPRTPCGVRPAHLERGRGAVGISIHAPLAGCDLRQQVGRDAALVISIHAPLAGCDGRGTRGRRGGEHFNPRTPCGVRRAGVVQAVHATPISIHAPLAGCDSQTGRHITSMTYFNPRTPCGVRQRRSQVDQHTTCISIHAPLAGCDKSAGRRRWTSQLFQSTHPLRGATTASAVPPAISWQFQSTHPLRGATTVEDDDLPALVEISIHAPLAGCDSWPACTPPAQSHFNPRTPCGVRRSPRAENSARLEFQSTHPLRGATRPRTRQDRRAGYFNPRTPCGVRRKISPEQYRDFENFNPRTPCGVRLCLAVLCAA